MFAEHPGRLVAVAVAAILLVIIVVLIVLMPGDFWSTIGLKLAAGLGYMAPAIVVGGLTGWISYNIRNWFWTTFYSIALTATVVIIRDLPWAWWSVASGAIYLCIPLVFYQLRNRNGGAVPQRGTTVIGSAQRE